MFSVVVYECDEGFKLACTSLPNKMPGDGRYGTNPKVYSVWNVDELLNEEGKAKEVVNRMVGHIFEHHVGKAIFSCPFYRIEEAFHKSLDFVQDPKNYFNNI